MRIYTLRTHDGGGWFTGLTKKGHLALMGIDFNAEVCAIFNQDGQLETVIERFFTANGQVADAPQDSPLIVSQAGWQLIRVRFAEWRASMIVVDAPIHVREFWIEGREIGIDPFPPVYHELIEDPDAFDEEDRRETAAFIEKWEETGMFTFSWNESFWCNADGSIDTS